MSKNALKIVEEKLGTYIFMGMGFCNGEKVCLSVAYKLDYSVKKALQFERASKGDVVFVKVNKVKVGELEAETSFSRTDLQEYERCFTPFEHIPDQILCYIPNKNK